MPNYMEAAFAPAERIYRRTMLHSVWGHLRAAAGMKYEGFILFTHGVYGDMTIIDWEFKAGDVEVEASPWVYDHINDYVQQLILPKTATKCQLESGKIYLFTGSYETEEDDEDPDNGRTVEGGYRFEGDVAEVPVSIPTRS